MSLSTRHRNKIFVSQRSIKIKVSITHEWKKIDWVKNLKNSKGFIDYS